tara:strand:- start:10660 stop:10998 length:339 start_codon:yes stop_codon:yes gene_type:complete
MYKQNTNISKAFIKILYPLTISFKGPWKTRSISLISLLSGYYFTANIITYLIDNYEKRIFILLTLILLIEMVIRIRPKFKDFKSISLFLLILDNLRLGATYSVVLEAFKLGS